MNCNNCNEVLTDDTKFCGGCGTKVESVEAPVVEAPVVETPVAEVPVVEVPVVEAPVVEAPVAEVPVVEVPSFSMNDILDDERKEAAKAMAKEAGETAKVAAKEAGETAKVVAKDFTEKVKKMPPQKLAIIGAAIVAVIVACVLMFGKQTIKIEDYVTVEFTGYEEAGKFWIDFDYYALAEDIALNTKDVYASEFEYIYYVIESIEFDYDEEDAINLSNGDKIEVEIEFDEEKAKRLDVKLKGGDLKFTVEGLKEVEELNPFEYITVEFSGTSPNASATIKYDTESNERMSSVRAELSKTSAIAQGDEVKVTITNADTEDTRKNGYVLTETEKTYKCEDVDRYVSKVEDINEKYTTKFEEIATDELEAYFVENDLTYKNLQYEGMYVLVIKEGTWNASYVYPVLSATISSTDKEIEATKLYFPMQMKDVIVTAEGEYIYNNSASLPAQESGIALKWFTDVVGYTDIDYMYQKIIVANKNNYDWDATKALIAN